MIARLTPSDEMDSMPQTLFRFVRPGFLGGMARTLDVGAALRFRPGVGESPAAQDARALGNDWRMVGADLRRAAVRVRDEAEPRPARDAA